jgi:hypothetical protein
MGNCDGNTWFSNVGGDFDGTLDLDRREHHHGGGRESFKMFCGGGLIIIDKRHHVYAGRLIEDGFYKGYKLSHRRGKKPFDEPTDGTWTAQQGPGEEGDDKKEKKARKKSAGKAAKGGTKKVAAKSGRKK